MDARNVAASHGTESSAVLRLGDIQDCVSACPLTGLGRGDNAATKFNDIRATQPDSAFAGSGERAKRYDHFLKLQCVRLEFGHVVESDLSYLGMRI